MRSIKDIDQDNNGYVTTTELDDILKYHLPTELSNRSLKPLFKPFASIQNRILIDYKKWKETLRQRLAEFENPGSATIKEVYPLTVSSSFYYPNRRRTSSCATGSR